MDGDLVTLLRTAAMSAAAASVLAPPEPRSLGFIGCGAQAMAHLAAFRALYGQLERVYAYSRSPASAQALAQAATAAGLHAEVVPRAETVLRHSDIVVTTVPAAAGLTAFLDPDWLPQQAFVAAVDVGRSWIATRLDRFDTLATDALAQAEALPGPDGNLAGLRFDVDLAGLAAGTFTRRGGRSLFSFKGFALGDLAIAQLVYERARQLGIGTTLVR